MTTTVALNGPVAERIPADTGDPESRKPTVVAEPEPRLVRFPFSVAEVTVTPVAADVVTTGGKSGHAEVVNVSVEPEAEPPPFVAFAVTE